MILTPVQLGILTLAAYRLAHMIAQEDGPFLSFARLRAWAGERYGWEHWIPLGLMCALCISFWSSLLLTWLAGGSVLDWLGVAGACLVVHQLLYRR